MAIPSRVLEAETLAKGIMKAGRSMPNSLKRELMQLDAAAARLRHPGAATRLIAKLRQWRAEAASKTTASEATGDSICTIDMADDTNDDVKAEMHGKIENPGQQHRRLGAGQQLERNGKGPPQSPTQVVSATTAS